MEITETVIFVKCCECRDFAKMPCFAVFFCQNAAAFCFHKNILSLISIIWSLLCEFNTKIFTFPLPLLLKSVCFVTYWRNMSPWHHRSMYFTRIYIFLQLETMNFNTLAAIWTAVILLWFLRFSQKCAVFFAIFCLDFLMSLNLLMLNHRRLNVFVWVTWKPSGL